MIGHFTVKSQPFSLDKVFQYKSGLVSTQRWIEIIELIYLLLLKNESSEFDKKK